MSGQSPPQWQQNQQLQYYQQPPPQYPPQYPPQQMLYPPVPQPPRNDSKIVAIVVVVVVLVIIVPTVAAFVLYSMVSGLLESDGNPTRPVVTFTSITKGGTPPNNHTASWTVAGASEPISYFSSFKVQITRDGSPLVGIAQTIRSNQIMTFGSSTVELIVHDLAGEGRLTGGDTFLVYGMTETHNWKLSLIWSADGSEIGARSWATP